MIHSIYEYYYESGLTLEEVLSDYVDNFYLTKYNDDKASKVIKKAIDSDGINELNGQSIKDRDFRNHFPNHENFINAIKKSLWFSLQSDRSLVLAVLSTAVDWDKKINRVFYIVDKETFRDDILLVFKKYKIMENISKNGESKIGDRQSLHVIYKAEKEKHAREFAEGIRWFVYKTTINLVKEITPSSDDLIIKDMYAKILKNAVEFAEGGSDIKRIAGKLGLNWNEIVDNEINSVILLKQHSYITLHDAEYGDSIDTIKFLENFSQTFHSR